MYLTKAYTNHFHFNKNIQYISKFIGRKKNIYKKIKKSIESLISTVYKITIYYIFYQGVLIMNTFLAIFYSFSLAFSPIYQSGDIKVNNANTVTSEFGVDLFEHLRIFGGFSSTQIPDTWYNYLPMTQKYSICAEGHFNLNSQTHFDIGVKRECSHPIDAWKNQMSNFNEANITFYMKISGTIPLILH